MSDFQVILLIGMPSVCQETSSCDFPDTLSALLEPLQQEEMLTLLHCASVGSSYCDDEPSSKKSTETKDIPVENSPFPQTATQFVERDLPDLICLFVSDEEPLPVDKTLENSPNVNTPMSYGEVLDFCRLLRETSGQIRPVIVIHGNIRESQRIQYLLQGADDILHCDLSPEEFKIRLLVHLRRNIDLSMHEMTRIPGLPMMTKVVQRRINRQEPVALLTLAVNNLDVYQESYGDLPTRQILKTCAALLGRILMTPPDFVCQTDENHFVIATHPDKAEKIASLLCRQFDLASPNFYSEQDRKRGYMVSVITEQISRRIPLLSLSVGLAYSHTQAVRTFTSLFNISRQMCSLAKMQAGSSWQGDRPRLATGEETNEPLPEKRPGVLVVETDAALAYLLKTTLSMEGYVVDVVSGIQEAQSILLERAHSRQINLVILDAVIHQEEVGLRLIEEIHQSYPAIRLICTSSLHNRQRVLQAGAHLYLPRPFELSSLFFWIHRLLPETLT